MKKVGKTFILLLVVITFCMIENVYAAGSKTLQISRFKYSEGDKYDSEENDSYFSTSKGMTMQLYASIGHDDELMNYAGKFVDTEVSSNTIWTSSNTNVATINSNGLVTTSAEGTTTITAKYTDSNNNEYTATRRITVFSSCHPSQIDTYNYYLFYSTGTPRSFVSVFNKTVGADDGLNSVILYSPKRDGYTFGGWYFTKEFREEDKMDDVFNADYDFSYHDNTCSLYKGFAVVYAKWIPNEGTLTNDNNDNNDNVNPTPSSNTAVTATALPANNKVEERVNVEDTGLNSSLYIIVISILLTFFGALIIIKSLNDKKQMQ